MTLLDIETFLAVTKFGNMAAASRNLLVTQPALTRRVQQLESELGYQLFYREKGKRNVTLTPQGQDFSKIAWKWYQLLEETDALMKRNTRNTLSVASVYSVTHPLLMSVYSSLDEEDLQLQLFNVLSENVYMNMEQGLFDIAFVEHQDHTKKQPADVQEHNAFSEGFVLVGFPKIRTPGSNGSLSETFVSPDPEAVLDTTALDTSTEIFIPWNIEFRVWHSGLFHDETIARIILEDVSPLSAFLTRRRWAFVPYMLGESLNKEGFPIYRNLKSPPPDRVIRYITRSGKNPHVAKLLQLLETHIRSLESDKIHSLM